jgi:hypothetical protein
LVETHSNKWNGGRAALQYSNFLFPHFFQEWIFPIGKMKITFQQRNSFVSPVLSITKLGIGLIIIAVGVMGWSNGDADDQEGETQTTMKTIEEVLREHTDQLMSLPGVVGTAQGLCDDKPCIKVFVIKKTQALDQRIPDTLDGYPVKIEETGEIKALPEDQK